VKRHKILLLLDGLGSGGAQYQMIQIANFLCFKYDVILLTYTDEDFFHSKLNSNVVHRKLRDKLSYFLVVLTYRRKVNVVLSFLDFPNFVNLMTAVFGSKSVYSERNGRTSLSSRNWRSLVLNSGGKVVYNNYRLFLKSSVKCAYYIPNMSYTSNCETSEDTRQDDALTFAVFASVSKVKNGVALIEAVKSMPKRIKGREIYFAWYGEVKEQRYAKEFFTAQEDVDNFTFMGPFKDLCEIKNSYDVGLLFSTYEGFSNSILDHLSLTKLVVIAPELGIGHGYDDVIFEMEDYSPINLQKGVEWTIDTINYGLDEGRFRTVLSDFSTEIVGSKWLEVLG
jgi:glycosyltransferase involved in cell wall biosynthesis